MEADLEVQIGEAGKKQQSSSLAAAAAALIDSSWSRTGNSCSRGTSSRRSNGRSGSGNRLHEDLWRQERFETAFRVWSKGLILLG